MAALATLLWLALPAFIRAIVITRRVSCANTLRHIHEAYGVRLMDIETNSDISSFDAVGWARELAPYFGHHRDAFWCIATGKSDGMGYDAEGDVGASGLPTVKIRVYNGGTMLYDLDTFNAYPYWLEGDHSWFGREPGIWKVNTDVYASLDRYNMPMYTIGPDSLEYWFVIEDQRVSSPDDPYGSAAGDTDFNDFDLHVLERAPYVKLTGYHRSAGYNFALVDMDGNVYGEDGGTIGPIDLEGKERLSYGMNSQVGKIVKAARSSHTILLVDYKYAIVYTGDSIGLSAGWDVFQAPRHMGKMNALYADGHVETHDPDEIDPAMSSGEPFWDPLIPLE